MTNHRKKLPSQMTAAEFRHQYVDQEEHPLQVRCVNWFRLAYPQLLLMAIPNGGLRDKVVAAKLKAEGVLRGMPDLFLAYPCGQYSGLWIETKTVNGRVEPEQAKAHAYLRSVGYLVIVPRTFEDMQQGVISYLSHDATTIRHY